MFALLTAIVAAATPGTATPGAGATPAATETPAPTRTAKPRGEQRYCVEEYLTGSRIPTRECRTRAEWLAQGYDPTKRD